MRVSCGGSHQNEGALAFHVVMLGYHIFLFTSSQAAFMKKLHTVKKVELAEGRFNEVAEGGPRAGLARMQLTQT